LEMDRQPSGALSYLLLELADTAEIFEDFPDVKPLAKGNKTTPRSK
jgi:hypothetical protein